LSQTAATGADHPRDAEDVDVEYCLYRSARDLLDYFADG